MGLGGNDLKCLTNFGVHPGQLGLELHISARSQSELWKNLATWSNQSAFVVEPRNQAPRENMYCVWKHKNGNYSPLRPKLFSNISIFYYLMELKKTEIVKNNNNNENWVSFFFFDSWDWKVNSEFDRVLLTCHRL